MKKWKYRFDTSKIEIGEEEWINKIGEEGWEVIQIIDVGDVFLIISKKQV